MRKEVAEMVSNMSVHEQFELVGELIESFSQRNSGFELVNRGVSHQVFGMIANAERDNFGELTMTQLNYMKELTDRNQ